MYQPDFWGKYVIEEGRAMTFIAGHAEIVVKRIENGWLFENNTKQIAADGLSATESQIAGIERDMIQFYAGASSDLWLAPALPDKAVVFRSGNNLKIGAGCSAVFFFRVPLSLQFYSNEIKDENRLFEAQSQRLSDTWFGEFDNGESAYSLGNKYGTTLSELSPETWEAVMPVEIVNSTANVLELQRIIMRVEDFHLYLKNGMILTNYATIEFKGQEQAGSVSLSVSEEIHGGEPLTIAKPRLTDPMKLLRRSFYFFKNFYQG